MAFLEFDTMKVIHGLSIILIFCRKLNVLLILSSLLSKKERILMSRKQFKIIEGKFFFNISIIIRGGAVHTEADLLARQNKLNAQQQKAKDEADALENERIRLETIKLEKEKKRAAKLAAQKTDWVAGDECWAPSKGIMVSNLIIL